MTGIIFFSTVAIMVIATVACVNKLVEAEKNFVPQKLGDPDKIAEKLAYEAATQHGNIYVNQEVSSAWAAMAFVETNASTRSVHQDESGNAVIFDSDGTVLVLSLYRDERGRFRYTKRKYLSPESIVLRAPDSKEDWLVIEHQIDRAEKALY